MAKQFYTKFAGIMEPDKAARINWLKRQFDRYADYWGPEIEMTVRNARVYWAVNFGQWPAQAVEKLRSQGRRPPTFPVIPDKIESLVGSFISNTFDIKLEPRNNKVNTLSLKMQDIITSDKFNLDWETSKIMCLLDSFIKVGYERICVTDLKDPYGNISFENLNPRHVYLQPGWKSMFNRDLLDYFVWDNKSVSEIKSIYPKSSPKLEELYEREKRDGIDYGIKLSSLPRWKSINDKWDGLHRVIEFHHVKVTDRQWEYDKKNKCWFPDNRTKQGSDEDKLLKLSYAQQQGLNSEDIVLLKQKKRIKYVEAICPELDKELFLDSGKDIIQVNGIGLHPLGIRYYGQYQGMVDRLYDIQLGINKGEMNIQDIQQRSAKGAFLLDRALSGGDPELERAIETAWNDPAARQWVDEGVTERLTKGGIIQLPAVNPSPEMFRQNDRYYDMADRFSKAPAAQDARTEGKNESGRLFKFKFEAGIIQQKFLMNFFERHERDKVSDAIAQAKITYAGVPRTFALPGGKETFSINEEAIDLFSGRKVVLDDISALPEMNVVLIPSKTSVSVRDDIKQTSGELMTATKDPLIQSVLQKRIALASELAGDEESKDEIENAFELAIQEAATTKMLNITNNKIQIFKLNTQLEALKNQMGAGAESTAEQAPEQQMTVGQRPDAEETADEGTPIEKTGNEQSAVSLLKQGGV